MPPLEDVSLDLDFGSTLSSGWDQSTLPVSYLVDDATRRTKRKAKRKQHKQVTFNKSVTIILIKSHTEISQRRKKRVWYSLEEAKTIRNDALETVRKMAQNQPLGPDETSRGLETKTPKEHRTRREHMQRTILVVLREQCRNFTSVAQDRWGNDENVNNPSFDDEYAAALYRHNSRQSVSDAIELAAINAEEVWGLQ